MKFHLAIAAALLASTSAGAQTAEPWPAKPVGNYDLTIVSMGSRMPAALSIVEKDGKLAATLTPSDDNEAHPMLVEVKGNDLNLTATTGAGVTMSLQHHGAQLSGTWAVHQAHGAVEGAMKVATQSAAPMGENWSAKPVGKYDLVLNRGDDKMEAEVTINESNGILIATFFKVGTINTDLMSVAVKGTELVLTRTTDNGQLELHITRFGNMLGGKWILGQDTGTLTGRAKS